MPKTIVVMGASAGGVESLGRVVNGFARDLQAAVVVALHMPRGAQSDLPAILGRAGPLETHSARAGDALQTGHIYVAPAGHDVIVEGGRLRVTKGAADNRFSPWIDGLFQSAAYEFGARSIGVVLSGMLDDGAAGVASIKRAGGRVIVETPRTAAFDLMPLAAMREVHADHVVPAHEIGPLVGRLALASRLPEWAWFLAHSSPLGPADPSSAPGSFAPGRWEDVLAFTCPACRAVLAPLAAVAGLPLDEQSGEVTVSDRMQVAARLSSKGDTKGDDALLERLEQAVMVAQHLATHAQEKGRHDLAAWMRNAELELARRATAQRRQPSDDV